MLTSRGLRQAAVCRSESRQARAGRVRLEPGLKNGGSGLGVAHRLLRDLMHALGHRDGERSCGLCGSCDRGSGLPTAEREPADHESNNRPDTSEAVESSSANRTGGAAASGAAGRSRSWRPGLPLGHCVSRRYRLRSLRFAQHLLESLLVYCWSRSDLRHIWGGQVNDCSHSDAANFAWSFADGVLGLRVGIGCFVLFDLGDRPIVSGALRTAGQGQVAADSGASRCSRLARVDSDRVVSETLTFPSGSNVVAASRSR